MPMYLLKVNYQANGLQGLLSEGGSSRRDVARATIESAGGRLECFYFAFGDVDAYLMAEFPDAASAAAAAMTVSSSGAVTVETVALLQAEEVDQATQKSVDYRAPGQ